MDETNAVGPPPAFGPYLVFHQVGRGGLGPVFRAHDPIHDRLIAVKWIALDIVPEDVTRLAAALRAVSARPVAHRGAVNVIAAGREGGRPYFATDYVAGESLELGLRHLAPMPLTRAVDLLRSLAEVIDAAWEAGVGHGALHPRDVFLRHDGSGVRVTGIGIALALHGAGLKAPVRHPYTAPERGDGRAWSIAADVYSIGAIAHELLTGRRPGAPEQEGELAALTAHERASVRRILATALAADPTERFDSARAFVHALKAVAADAVPVLPPEPTATAEPQLPPQPTATAAPQLPSGPDLERPTALAASMPVADVDLQRAAAPVTDVDSQRAAAPVADVDLQWASAPVVDLDLQRPSPLQPPPVMAAPLPVRPPSTLPAARFPRSAMAAAAVAALLVSFAGGYYAVRLRHAPAPAVASDPRVTVTEVRVAPDSPAVPQSVAPAVATNRGKTVEPLPGNSMTAPRGALSGSWVLTNRVEQSNVADFHDLTLSFRLQLNQDGNHVSGQGLKWTENGRQIPSRGRTPITVTGTIEGNKVMLAFTERGTRRTSHGRLELQLIDDGVLAGRFSSGAGESSGRARAVRLSSS